MASGPTWSNPISSYFTPTDVEHMKQVAKFDLSKYKDVVANADNIYEMVSSGAMPPGNPWPQEWVNNFATWAQNGFPES